MPVTDTNYNSTLAVTDVVNEDGVFDVDIAVRDNGTLQGALYTLMNSIVTNFNLCNAKLDLDGGVTGTTYATNCDISTMAVALLSANGMHQPDLVTQLQLIETKFEVLTAQLDADAGVSDETYASTHDFDMDTTKITAEGMDQGSMVSYLQTVVTKFNALLTQLDADAPSSSPSTSPSASVSSSPSTSVSASPSASPSSSISASPSASVSASPSAT